MVLRVDVSDTGMGIAEPAQAGLFDAFTQADPSTLKEIEALGVTVTKLSEAEVKAFRDATRPVYDKWKARVGNDLVASAEKAVSARSS